MMFAVKDRLDFFFFVGLFCANDGVAVDIDEDVAMI